MKVLNFDRSQIGQETGFWCGPATVQNALKIQNIHIAERDIARQTEALEGNHGWDDQDGTDNIRQLATVLNRYIKDAEYTVVEIPNDPPSLIQRDRFWDQLVEAIDAGYGVPMNWIAPPGNHPRGQLGTRSPNYSGTIFHYVLADGYATVNGVRYVHIADSGFQPSGYWITLEQCVSLIASKGYAPLKAVPDFDPKPVIDFIKTYIGPIASDVRDVRGQVCFEWPHLKGDLKSAVGYLIDLSDK